MIIATQFFKKELSRFDALVKDGLISLISKYDRWLSKNLFQLSQEGDLLILKWYLNGKRIRVMVAKTQKGNYIPLEILKKESRDGYNIRQNYDSSSIVERANSEIIEDQYEIWNLKI